MIEGKKFWLGVAITVALLALFLLTVDVGRMVRALAGADYVYVIPAVVLYLVSIAFRTLRWQFMLAHMRRVPLRRLYPVVVVGYMANNLLPMRLGEVVRSYYVGEREHISKTSALVTIVVERLLDALTLLFFLAVMAVFVPIAGLVGGFGERWGLPWGVVALAFSLPFVVAFVGLTTLALAPELTRRAALLLVAPLPQRVQGLVEGLVDTVLRGLTPLRSPGTLGLLFLLSFPVWLSEAAVFFTMGFAFDLDVAYGSLARMAVGSVIVTAVANLGSSVPAAPGGVGLFELVTREALVLMPLAQVDRSVAAGFAAIIHAAMLLPMIFLGQVFLWVQQVSLRRLSEEGRKASAEARLRPAALTGEEPEP